MPLSYPDGTIAEHTACRSDAVVFDVSHLGTVRVTGPDALERLQWALTNDLTKVTPGRAQYTHLLDELDGSVLDDIIVWWLDEETFERHAERQQHRPGGGGDRWPGDHAPRAPCSPSRVRTPALDWPPSSPRRQRWADSASSASRGRRALCGGRDRIHRRGRRGDRRARRPCRRPVACAARRRDRAGWPRRPRHAAPGGRSALARPRTRGRHHAPPGRARLVVAWRKDGFRGRQALEVEKARGVDRLLRGIVTEGRRPPRSDCDVLIGDRVVGQVTSGNFSPVLGCGIALAFLPPDIEDGTPVSIDVRGAALPGTRGPDPLRRQVLTAERFRAGGRPTRPGRRRPTSRRRRGVPRPVRRTRPPTETVRALPRTRRPRPATGR